MMRLLVVLTAALFSLVNSAEGHGLVGATPSPQTLCNNNMFTNPHQWGAASTGNPWSTPYTMPSAPIPFEKGAATCKYYQHHKTVCCSKDTLKLVEQSFKVAQDSLKNAIDGVDDAASLAHEIINQPFVTLVQGICEAIKSDMCTKVTSTITKYENKLIDNFKAMIQNQIKCAKATIAYAEGMACFACEAQWINFLDLENQIVTIAEDTCDAIYDSCEQTIWHDGITIAQTIQEFVQALIQDVSGTTIPGWNPNKNPPDFCGGTFGDPSTAASCKKFVCHTMLDGLKATNWQVGASSMPWYSTAVKSRRLSAAAPSQSIGLQRELSAEELAAHVHKAGQTLVQEWEDLMTNHQRYVLKSAAANAGHNTYSSSGGYNAYKVGCAESNIDCGPGFPAWATALCGVAAFAVVAGLVFAVYRRRRANQENQPLL